MLLFFTKKQADLACKCVVNKKNVKTFDYDKLFVKLHSTVLLVCDSNFALEKDFSLFLLRT